MLEGGADAASGNLGLSGAWNDGVAAEMNIPGGGFASFRVELQAVRCCGGDRVMGQFREHVLDIECKSAAGVRNVLKALRCCK